MSNVRSQVQGAGIFSFVYTLMVVVFDMLPSFEHLLPMLIWLPYDPYAGSARYIFTYIYEVGCTYVATMVCLCTNMYMFSVLICLSFNYELLGARAKRIGHRDAVDGARATRTKVDVYRDIIDLVRLHLKMNQ